jgi:periplasmic protein TonB
MPAPAGLRPRERVVAIVAAALVQLTVGLALLVGLRVSVRQPAEIVERLIEVALPRAPSPIPPPQPRKPKPRHRPMSAPAAQPKPTGGSPGPKPAHAPPSVAAVVAVQPSAARAGGGGGAGTAPGSTAGGGGGARGAGYGDDEGGTDLVHIAGEILPSDYPRHLGNSGIGGRVGVLLDIGANGHVTRCSIRRSSGVAELDALTCRLMEERFRFRPSTDRYGRPIPDEVEWDHDWIAR